MKFQLSDHSDRMGQVHVHIYPGTQSIMIQGDSGVVVGRKPFIAFSDFYLEPLFNRLINDNKDNNGDVKKSEDEISQLVKKKIKLLTNDNVEDKVINNVTTSNNSNDAFKISSESKFNEGIV